MKVLLVCERSGGHIFPALVFADSFKKKYSKDCNITFFLTADFLKDNIAREGYGVVGKVFKRRFLVFELLYRFFEAIFLLIVLRPEKVIGFGGRDSIFLLLFARIFGAHTALYEPNVEFGKANAFLSLFVNNIYTGFDTPEKHNKKIRFVGIPLRSRLKPVTRQEALKIFGFFDKPVVLCFGGSQGSVFLNDLMLYLDGVIDKDCQFIHFTGRNDYKRIEEFYRNCGRRVFVRDFYTDMHYAYSAADIVICRSGASTVAEVSYFSLPAIFIPHPAASGHQKANASSLVRAGAAFLHLQNDFCRDKFVADLNRLLTDKKFSQEMRLHSALVPIGVEFEKFYRNIDF